MDRLVAEIACHMSKRSLSDTKTKKEAKPRKPTLPTHPPKPTKLPIIRLRTVGCCHNNLTNQWEITEEEKKKIKDELQNNGVCVFGALKDKKWREEAIKEMVGHLEGQPRVDEFKIKIPRTTDLRPKEVRLFRSHLPRTSHFPPTHLSRLLI